jgi:hypothetical protein
LAFHPQADGRSERKNKTISQILRTYTAKKQGKWLEALPAVEFSINSAVNASTGVSPLELILGRQPTLFESTRPTVDDDPPPTLSKWLALHEAAWGTSRKQALY